MKEDDAMVYRRPYLTSGSSGFALNAISRAMKKQLKVNIISALVLVRDPETAKHFFVCRDIKFKHKIGSFPLLGLQNKEEKHGFF